MALPPLKRTYKKFEFEPLHIQGVGSIVFAVEGLNIGQTFNPKYADTAVYGRMDGIPTYQSTGRSLTISFTCQAHQLTDTGEGVIDNITRVNLLTQCLYPVYTHGPSAVLKAPPFFRIKYGNYIGGYGESGEVVANEGLTGYITGFSHGIGPVTRNVAFGTVRDKKGDNVKIQHLAVPRKIDINFGFTVIHDRPVGWTTRNGKDFFSYDEPYIRGYGENFPYNVGKERAIAPMADIVIVPESVVPGSVENKIAVGQAEKSLDPGAAKTPKTESYIAPGAATVKKLEESND